MRGLWLLSGAGMRGLQVAMGSCRRGWVYKHTVLCRCRVATDSAGDTHTPCCAGDEVLQTLQAIRTHSIVQVPSGY